MAGTDPGACPAPVGPARLQPHPCGLLLAGAWAGLGEGTRGRGQVGWCPYLLSPSQVSIKVPEASVILPVFVGNIPVNHPQLFAGPPPGALSQVLPSAPPQEEVEAEAGEPHARGLVSLSTKSHSQQQPAPEASHCMLGSPESRPQDDSPAPHSVPPPLCISTGATIPYFAEGSGGPVPTTSTLILPPEYSSWGYPYGEWGAWGWLGQSNLSLCRPGSLSAEAPPSYEQSCGSADPGLSPGS